MFYQGTLFGSLTPPAFDLRFAEAVRWPLDATCWVEHVPGWLTGADQVFDELIAVLPLTQRTGVRMYDRTVDEPRLSTCWTLRSGQPEPSILLGDVRRALTDRYDEAFDSIGFNLYRDGADSVAWHADRVRGADAEPVVDPVIAIVSVGAPRPFRLRPKGGGRSYGWSLGNGDLFVMGGACQTLWEHTVPKVRVTTGPRLSITFRASHRKH